MLRENEVLRRLDACLARYKELHSPETAEDRAFMGKVKALKKIAASKEFSLKLLDDTLFPEIKDLPEPEKSRYDFLFAFNAFCMEQGIGILIRHDNKRTQPENRRGEWVGKSEHDAAPTIRKPVLRGKEVKERLERVRSQSAMAELNPDFTSKVESLGKVPAESEFSLKAFDDAPFPGISNRDSLKTRCSKFVKHFNAFCEEQKIDLEIYSKGQRVLRWKCRRP